MKIIVKFFQNKYIFWRKKSNKACYQDFFLIENKNKDEQPWRIRVLVKSLTKITEYLKCIKKAEHKGHLSTTRNGRL